MVFSHQITKLSELIQDVITGALIRTAATGNRWELQGGAGLTGIIKGFSGDAAELIEAGISIVTDTLTIFGNELNTSTTGSRPFISLFGGAGPTNITAHAEEYDVIHGATFDQLIHGDDTGLTISNDRTTILPGALGVQSLKGDNSGFLFGGGGNPIQAIAGGVVAGNISATADLVITHGLKDNAGTNLTPATVIAIMANTDFALTKVNIKARAATTFTLHFVNSTTGADRPAGTNVTAFWMAFA